MPTETKDDGRSVAATIFAGAATGATVLAAMVPEPARAALKVAANLSNMIAKWITQVGVSNVSKLVEELQRRRDEGKISSENIATDDAEIASAVSDIFGGDKD